MAYGGYALFVWCVGVKTSNVHRNLDCIFTHFLLSVTFEKSVVSCRYESFFPKMLLRKKDSKQQTTILLLFLIVSFNGKALLENGYS